MNRLRQPRKQAKETAEGLQGQIKLGNQQLEQGNRQLDQSEQGQITDRYTKAIDQLDAGKTLAVRIGGLYALERIARDSPPDRITIAEVLCAYVRGGPYDGQSVSPEQLYVYGAPPLKPLNVRAPDMQAAVTILGRWQERLKQKPPYLHLHNAELQKAYLDGAQLPDVELNGAQGQGAVFNDANLQDAVLSGAMLTGAELQGADLRGAQLQGADLRGAVASKRTRWPDGWDHDRLVAAGVEFVPDATRLTST